MKDLTKGNITRLILAFAIPVLIANVLQLAYSLIDTKMVSQILGDDGLAAVGATNSVNTLVIGFLNGLTNGFAVIASNYYGAGDKERLKKSVAMSLALGIITAVILTAVVLTFLMPLLRILNTPEEFISTSYDYIFIIFAGMTILMLYNVCCALLRAIGDTITPLIFLAISVTLNVAGDYVFMSRFEMGVKGAAIATVLSQFLAMISCMVYMFKKYEILRFSLKDLKAEKNMVVKLISCGCSMGLMSSLVSFGSVALQTSINTFGKSIINAHTIARKITEFFMLIFAVLGTTMATFCGQNLGAGKISRIKKGVCTAYIMAVIWSAVMAVLSYTVAPLMIKSLASTDDSVVIDTASLYLRIDTLLYFVTAAITVLRNAMQGIGDHRTPVISSMVELVGKVLVVILLVPVLGYMGIILAEPIVWVLMVIPLIVQWFRNPVLKQEDSR